MKFVGRGQSRVAAPSDSVEPVERPPGAIPGSGKATLAEAGAEMTAGSDRGEASGPDWDRRVLPSGTSDSKNAAETPKATMVVNSASVLRDKEDSAATNRAMSKHVGSSLMPAIAV